jgi:hypothetical protein
MLGTDIANACDASGWQITMTPSLRCLEVTESGEEGFELHNTCSDPIEITPVACEDPCDDTLQIAPSNHYLLELATSQQNDVTKLFNYKHAEQTGTIDFTCNHNPCTSEDGCSITSPGSRLGHLSVSAFLMVVTVFVTRRRSRSSLG